MQSNIFSLSINNKTAKDDFTKKVKIAKENAEKGKFARIIQRRYRAEKIIKRERLVEKDIAMKKLRDLGKILKIEKIRKVFFLPIDKMVGLLVNVCNSISLKQLRNKTPDIDEISQMFSILAELLRCAFNFTDPKAITSNILYNYLIGSKKATFTLSRFIDRLQVASEYLVQHDDDACRHALKSIYGIAYMLQANVQIADCDIDMNSVNVIRKRLLDRMEALVELLLPYAEVDGGVDSRAQVEYMCVDRPVYRAQVLLIELRAGNTSADWAKIDAKTAQVIVKSIRSGQEVQKLVQLIDLERAVSIDISSGANLVRLVLDIILREKVGASKVIAHPNIIKVFLTAFSIRAKEINSTNFQISEDKESDIDTEASILCDKMADFLLKLSLINHNDDLLTGVLTSFKYNDQVFRDLIVLIYNTLQSTIKLNMASTTIIMPKDRHYGYFSMILGVLKYRMLISTVQEFLNIGPNLDKILQILFYLQNFLTYYELLGGLDETKGFLIKSTAEVVKQFGEYNKIKQFYEPSRLKMCKLNIYFYDSLTSMQQNQMEGSLETVHSLLCLFPTSIDFKSRVTLLPKLISSTATSTTVYAKVKRQTLIDDCCKIAQAISGNPGGKIKIVFVDQFGHEETGHDDGGLWKEFVLLSLEKVRIFLI